MKPIHDNGRRTAQATKKSLLVVAMFAAFTALSACGGSSDTSVDSGGSTQPTTTLPNLADPDTREKAIDYQYAHMKAYKSSIESLLNGDAMAVKRLLADDFSGWDDYWQTDYPARVDVLGQAVSNLQKSEDFVQKLVYGIEPAASGHRPDTKFVPIPIVVGAIVVGLHIYAKEKERLSGVRTSATATAAERENFIQHLEQAYQRSGLNAIQARSLATINAGKVSTLRALQDGIDRARGFVFSSGLKPAMGPFLPSSVKTGLTLNDLRRKASSLRDSVLVILDNDKCQSGTSSQQSVSASEGPAVSAKELATCQIYYCETDTDDCNNLPTGQWQGLALGQGHLRGTDNNINATANQAVSLDATPIEASEVEDQPPLAQCSQVQTAGRDQADTRTLPMGKTAGTFTFSYQMYTIKDQISILHDGNVIFNSGCVSNSATQSISFAGNSPYITVQVNPNCQGTSGTAWNYSVSCPQ